MKITATIFDMDGLLIDSEKIALRVFQEISNQHTLGDQFHLYLRVLGTNDATTHDILQNTLPESIDVKQFMSMWSDRYHEETNKAVPLMKGVNNLLDYLHANGIPTAVATSTNTDRALHKLEQSGILHRFTTITGGDQVANGKPAPDIYLKAAKSIDADPLSCLALEDSPNGVRAAVAARMHVVQIPDLLEPDEALLSLGHTVHTDLDAVLDYLKPIILAS